MVTLNSKTDQGMRKLEETRVGSSRAAKESTGTFYHNIETALRMAVGSEIIATNT